MRYHLGVVALALCVALATALPPLMPVLSAAVNDDPQPPQPTEQPPQPTEQPPQPTEQPPQPTEQPPQLTEQPPQPTEQPPQPTEQPPQPTEQPPQPTEQPPPAPTECTLGEKKGNAVNCRKYSECKDNAWVEKSCYWFWKFDSVSKKCVFWGATCTTN